MRGAGAGEEAGAPGGAAPCRCCLGAGELGLLGDNPERRDYAALLARTLALGVTDPDITQRHMICCECVAKLKLAYDFKVQIQQSKNYFRTLLAARTAPLTHLPNTTEEISFQVKFEDYFDVDTALEPNQQSETQEHSTNVKEEVTESYRQKIELREDANSDADALDDSLVAYKDLDIVSKNYYNCLEDSQKMLDDYNTKLTRHSAVDDGKTWEIQSRIFQKYIDDTEKLLKQHKRADEQSKRLDKSREFKEKTVNDNEDRKVLNRFKNFINTKKKPNKLKVSRTTSLLDQNETDINYELFDTRDDRSDEEVCGKEQTDAKKVYLLRVTNGHRSEIKITQDKNLLNKKHIKDMTVDTNFDIANDAFRCKTCGKVFCKRSQATTHLYTHNTKYVCDFCGESFMWETKFRAHQAKHKIDEVTTKRCTQDISVEGNFHMIGMRFHCNNCSDSFRNRKHAVTHLHMHYPNFICDLCGKSFAWQKHLNSHLHIHRTRGLPGYVCSICGRRFKLRDSLRYHFKGHSMLLNKCPHCPERFKYYTHKLKHLVAVHNYEENTYKCKSCPKSFSNATSLCTHVKRIHKGLRPYKCSECEMSFYSSYLLKCHMTKHTGIKQFECVVCSKSFSRKYNLKEHMKSHIG